MNNPGNPDGELKLKGSALIDYLKIIRANPDLDWSEYLLAEDFEQLDQMVLPSSWYPAGLFERMGIAIFHLVSNESMEVVRNFGRIMADKMSDENPGLVVAGGPGATLNRYLAIQERSYSFEVFTKSGQAPGRMAVHIDTGKDADPRAVPLLVCASKSTMERLLELSGAEGIAIRQVESSLTGADRNSLEIKWTE